MEDDEKPNGKSPPGQVQIRILANPKEKQVRIEFGQPVGWITFDSLGVAQIIKTLGECLRQIQTIEAPPPKTLIFPSGGRGRE